MSAFGGRNLKSAGSRTTLSFADHDDYANERSYDRLGASSPALSVKSAGTGHRSLPTPNNDPWGSAGKMPSGLLQQNYDMRHVAPAGLLLSRQVSPFGIGSQAFGTEYGTMLTGRAEQQERQRMYHYEPPTSPQSPVSSTSFSESRLWSREGKRQPSNPAELQPSDGPPLEWPAWHTVPEEAKYRWPISRDRYSPTQKLPQGVEERSDRGARYLSSRRLRPDTSSSSSSSSSWTTNRLPAPSKLNEVRAAHFLGRSSGSRTSQIPPPESQIPTGEYPSWSRIDTGFKHDWCLARSRYDLHRFPVRRLAATKA